MLSIADRAVYNPAYDSSGPRELDRATCDLDLSSRYNSSRSLQGHGSNGIIDRETVTSPRFTSLSSEQLSQTAPTTSSARVYTSSKTFTYLLTPTTNLMKIDGSLYRQYLEFVVRIDTLRLRDQSYGSRLHGVYGRHVTVIGSARL